MNQVRAIIPAAGIGKRMQPLTHTRPKVLLPIAGRPMIGHLIADLVRVGIRDISVVVGYFGEKVEEYCGNAFPDVSFRFISQIKRLGLGHAIGKAIQPDDKKLLVVLGDTIYKGDIGQFGGDEAALGLVEVDDPRRFGVAVIENDYIVDLEEKPEKPRSKLAIAGVYYFPDGQAVKKAVETLITKDIRTRGEYQITDAMQLMIEDGHPFRPVMIEGWYDCGVPESLVETNRVLLDRNPDLRNVPEKVRDGNVIVDPVFIDNAAEIQDSVIGPYVHISGGCRINRCILTDTLINENCVLEGVHLNGAVLGMEVSMKEKGHSPMAGDHCSL